MMRIKSDFEAKTVVDLSHALSEGMPQWPGDPPTLIQPKTNVEQDGYTLNELTIGEHTGTHIGAPNHFGGAMSVDDIRPEKLLVRGVKINISGRTAGNPDYLLSINDIFEWEARLGTIPDGCLALVQTDWSEQWHSPNRYFGIAADGKHFPGISTQAVEFLLRERQVVGIGIDTAGIDGGQSVDFEANKLAANQGVYHLENLAHLKSVADKEFFVFVGALKITGGSGSPCRILAFSLNI